MHGDSMVWLGAAAVYTNGHFSEGMNGRQRSLPLRCERAPNATNATNATNGSPRGKSREGGSRQQSRRTARMNGTAKLYRLSWGRERMMTCCESGSTT